MSFGFLLASFLIPGIAAAAVAAAVAVPIAVHLLSKQRERVVRWAAMRFLPIATTRRHRRVDHWPLMLVRLLVLSLPLLAMFAVLPASERLWQAIRPGALDATHHGPRTHTILILDATLSMKAAHDGGTTFEAARQAALSVIDAAQPGDGFSVLVLDGSAAVRIAGPSNHVDVVTQEIRSIAPFDGPSDLPAALAAAGQILGRSSAVYAHRQVLIFTDFQRTAWKAVLPSAERPEVELWPKLAARAHVAVIDVGQEDLQNLVLSDLSLADSLPLVDDPITITATVQNPSRTERRNVRVDFAVARQGGPLVKVGQRVFESIPADGQASAMFTLEGTNRVRSPGPLVISATLPDTDAILTDNTRSLSLSVRDGLNILLVNGHPSGSPLKRASEFFAEALAPGGRASPGNPFRTRTVSPEEFADATLTDLAAVDCVVLCDVPAITPSQVLRLEGLLKRGGGVVLGLGPYAVANREIYNRLLGSSGSGWLPGLLLGIATEPAGFHLSASEKAFESSPLAAFQDANARAGLSAVPFLSYVKLDIPADSSARIILNFAESGNVDTRPDPALLEVPKHRGRVMIFTSTLHREWTDWPILPSYLPFAHELVRHATGNLNPWTTTVGEVVEENLPSSAVGQTATLIRPDGSKETATVSAAEAGGVARFNATTLAGLYEVQCSGSTSHRIAVNLAATVAGLGESDLRRMDRSDFTPQRVQVVRNVSEIEPASGDGTSMVLSPRPHGPAVARIFILLALAALVVEMLLAWRLSPSRWDAKVDGTKLVSTVGDRLLRWMAVLVVVVLIISLAVLSLSLLQGNLPPFVPHSVRAVLETMLEVPRAGPGEATRWRLTSQSVFASDSRLDHWLVTGTVLTLMAGAAFLYWRERRTVPTRDLLLPFAMRAGAYALFGLLLLPQIRIVFEREGYPEIVLLLDTSASMATVDAQSGAAPRLEQVIQHILQAELLETLLAEQRVRLRVYSLAEQATLTAAVDEPDDLAAARAAVRGLKPDGTASRLGDGVEAVLRAHKGGTLAAAIIFTDGITTQGADLADAGRQAARAGVPLFAVAVGERRETLDLAIADLKMDDVVAKGDELIIEGRLQTRGKLTEAVPVTLFEKTPQGKVAIETIRITPDAAGKPMPIKLKHRPTTTGERTYIIETPSLPGETDIANNRVERTVMVTEGRKLRVLFIEGRPRYEFRFVKTLLEREVETVGERSLDFHFLLLDAGKDFATTDRGALRAFPSRSELFEYDVVLLGDIDPALLPQPATNLTDLADFVRVRGGGLLVIAGEQAMPAKLFETPLAPVLPVTAGIEIAAPNEDRPLTEGYRLRLTPLGRQHPLLRFASNESENAALWQRLAPLLWTSSGFVKRQTAEILATHPQQVAEGTAAEPKALILQQFAGAGRVMFFGFDETWRWRLGKDEELFNRFWRQAVRVMARNRVSRVELQTTKPGPYRRDEPVVVAVRFPDDAPVPTGLVKVSMERTTAAGDRELSTLVLTATENTRATFQATLTNTVVGQYRLKLVEPAGVAASVEFNVIPPPGEMERLDVDLLELNRAASESGGKFYRLEKSESLLADLPEGSRPPLDQPCPPVTLWNLPLTFVTLLSLLALEWVLRRRARLL